VKSVLDTRQIADIILIRMSKIFGLIEAKRFKVLRIAGINIPSNKKVYIGLTSIYGIGQETAKKICMTSGIDPYGRVSSLSEEQSIKLREVIDANYVVEGEKRKEVQLNIQRLKEIKSYRGSRHIRKLPVRGQRTHTNARTRKGKAVAIAGKKQVSK